RVLRAPEHGGEYRRGGRRESDELAVVLQRQIHRDASERGFAACRRSSTPYAYSTEKARRSRCGSCLRTSSLGDASLRLPRLGCPGRADAEMASEQLKTIVVR